MKRNKCKLVGALRSLPIAKKCLAMLFVANLVLIGNLCAQTPQIWPVEIRFNYESGSTHDAITIRKNASTEITVPEYKKDVRNENCAYIKSQCNRKIRVKFDSNNPNMNYLVKASVISGTGIGNACEIFVASCYLNSTFFTVELSGSVPGSVGSRTFTWQWEATALPIDPPYCPVACAPVNTEHTYYTLLATPQAPMDVPWTDALDYACDWADGEATASGAATKITESLYSCGFRYETDLGSPAYYVDTMKFDLEQIISDIKFASLYEVNCLDMAMAVVTFGNALGSGLNLSTFSGGFPLNCIDPIGSPSPTNNTFRTTLIGDDCRTGGFGYHAFAENDAHNVWDATLRYDIDSNPDNVFDSNPECGNTTTGYTWKLPCNETEPTYIERLVDDWNRPNEEEPIDCSNRENCGSFSREIEFTIHIED